MRWFFSHNGITVTGSRILKRGKAVVMESATIVNGAQTVSYFGNPAVMKVLSGSGARVLCKFVKVADADKLNDIESKVAFRSNNQNKVEPSDLMIELSSLVSLQRYFRRSGVHLERKKGELRVHFGELRISKERLAQVLASVGSAEGAVKAKRKQKLFEESAYQLFADFDVGDDARAEALCWTRVDDVFGTTIASLGNLRRRKRGQLAGFAVLTVFHRVLRSTQWKSIFLRRMAQWRTDHEDLEGGSWGDRARR